MDMFKNLVYQTCKSFTYFSALLEAANCLRPQKKKKKECYIKVLLPAIKDNRIKKEHCILIIRFSFKCYYIDS